MTSSAGDRSRRRPGTACGEHPGVGGGLEGRQGGNRHDPGENQVESGRESAVCRANRSFAPVSGAAPLLLPGP